VAQGRDRPGVIAPPPVIYLAGLGLGFLLEALLPSASLPNALSIPLGIALIVAGVALQTTFIMAFRRAGTNVDPYRPSKAVVTSGPYRLTRNPGYVGFTLIVSGIGVLAEALWVFAALIPTIAVMDRGVIAREERYLERKFGEEYSLYKSRVRRWI
jgi:protein-S-isoprenylcysteine O-methyltransferase Ste14